MAETIRFVLCALFTLGGLFILITGVVGVYRFHYALNRVHSAALIDTLGILLMLIGVMIAEGLDIATLKMLFVILTRCKPCVLSGQPRRKSSLSSFPSIPRSRRRPAGSFLLTPSP